MVPLRIAVDLLQPSPPIESSLHLMLFPFVQIRHRSMDLAYHPGLGPLPDRSRSRDDYSGHLRHSCRSQERFLERFVPSDAPSHSRMPRSRDSLLLITGIFTGVTFATEDAIRIKEVTFATPDAFRIKRVSLSKRMGSAPWGSPSSKRMEFASRGSPSP